MRSRAERGGIASLPPARPALAPSAHRPGRPSAARAVGSYVPKLTKTVMEKFGFSTATLLTDWASVVGPELAACTSPERLKWQRGVVEDEDGGGRPGATLVLRVEGSRAIDVQMKARQIIERINAMFGYRAVGELRIVQGPVAPTLPVSGRHERARAPVVPDERVRQAVAGVADDGLREALARLGANVAVASAR